MADQRKTLERFVRQQVFRSRDNALEKFVLRSAGVGARGAEVDTFPVAPDVNSDNIGMVVDEILMRAQSDADAQGSKLQRYSLVALEIGARDGARFPFRVRGEGEEDGEDGDELVPSEKGVATQLMRHNEALMRMFIMNNGAMLQGMARRIESNEKTIDIMFQDKIRALEAIESAKSLQHDRDVQMLLTSGQEDRKNEMFKKLEAILPLVVNKVAGRPILPEGPGGDIFKHLADSLSPDQLQKIAPYLTQEQQMLLMTLLKAAREESASQEQNGVS